MSAPRPEGYQPAGINAKEDLQGLCEGDRVVVVKDTRNKGKTGVVLQPNWRGLWKVEMDEPDDKGNVKTYKASDLQLMEAAAMAKGDFQGLREGDRVVVTKDARTKGKTGMVLQSNWRGLVKVEMDEADEKGKVKSYMAADLQLIKAAVTVRETESLRNDKHGIKTHDRKQFRELKSTMPLDVQRMEEEACFAPATPPLTSREEVLGISNASGNTMCAVNDDAASSDGLAAVTQSDLKCHFDKMQRLLLQIKSELLTEQKRTLERAFPPLEADLVAKNTSAQAPCILEQGALSSLTRNASKLSKHSCSTHTINIQHSGSSQSRFQNSAYRRQISTLADAVGSPHKRLAGKDVDVIGSPASSASNRANGTNAAPRTRFSKDTVGMAINISHRSNPSLHSETSPTLIITESKFSEFIKSPIFDIGCGAVICFNIIILGVETEYLAQVGDIPQFCSIIHFVLNGWYMLELCLRMCAERRSFLTGPNRNWNMLDSVLLATTIIDLLLSGVHGDNLKSARILRSVRLFRIVRTLRILRQFTYVREFRKMVCSMLSSVQTLFWSLLLVFGVMYSFALWFTQSAAYYRNDSINDPTAADNVMDIDRYYATFSRTVFSLFGAIAGGYSWHVLVEPWIAGRFHLSVCFFLAYVSITVFGLMNIVTSIFVDSAMHATKHFQDLLVDEKRKDLEMYTAHMEAIFHVIDHDGGGTISFEEMESFLEDDTSELRAYLEAIGITSNDVWVLFRLLDEKGTGSINIEAFCSGCMKLKGEARSFDINCLLFENRAMGTHQADFMEFVEEQFQTLSRLIPQVVVEIDKRFARRVALLTPKMTAQPIKSVPLGGGRVLV